MTSNRVISDIINLSSGTMSVLTRKNNYEELDKIQFEFLTFAQNNKETFNNWVEAWTQFEKINN